MFSCLLCEIVYLDCWLVSLLCVFFGFILICLLMVMVVHCHLAYLCRLAKAMFVFRND